MRDLINWILLVLYIAFVVWAANLIMIEMENARAENGNSTYMTSSERSARALERLNDEVKLLRKQLEERK
jgi:hypothetical protein